MFSFPLDNGGAADNSGTDNGGDTADNTGDGSDSGGADDAAGGEEPPAEAPPSAEIYLDHSFGCYCPGDNSVPESPVFKDKPADYKVLLAVIAEKRREAQLNFTVSVIPEAVEVVERSKLPTAPVLSKMFPDLGDGFAVDTWLASLSKITKKAVNDIKNTTAIKMQERLSVSSAVRAIASKFDYSKYAPPPPATEYFVMQQSSHWGQHNNTQPQSTDRYSCVVASK